MKSIKAIIPVAGAGTKLRPLTYSQPKPLIPVGGKPIISIIIDQLLESGIDDFVFIIGYLGEKIKSFVNEHYPNIRKAFVYQSERDGLGHAIWSVREEIKTVDEIIIFLGDTIVDVNLKEMLDCEYSCLAIKKVTDPRKFGVVQVGPDGFIQRVQEKPNIPTSNHAIVGLYKIKEIKELLKSIEYIIENNIKTHDEYQLTDGLMHMIEKGIPFKSIVVDNWYDCGKKEILLETNAMLLDRNHTNSKYPEFQNTIIIPPVSIGEQCDIRNSIIGPHVTVGRNVKIESSIVRESIIGNFASIADFILHASIIGNDAFLKGGTQSLNVGDNTEIDFN